MPAFISGYLILILFKDNTTKNTVAIATVFFVCDIHPINNRVTSGDPQAP